MERRGGEDRGMEDRGEKEEDSKPTGAFLMKLDQALVSGKKGQAGAVLYWLVVPTLRPEVLFN